jgi:hypothetical protein
MNDPIVFITSMNERLFTDYGRNLLSSWIQYSSLDAVLVVCYDDDDNKYMREFDTRNIIQMSIWSDEMRVFFDKYGQFAEANGFKFTPNSLENWKSASVKYDHRFDAMRFSFKSFALKKCIEAGLTTNLFAWLDADVVCHHPFSPEKLKAVFPAPDELATYLGRQSYPQPIPYTECGFVGYNGQNPATFEFLKQTESFYTEGNLFFLSEWHDCLVFDYLRGKFEEKGEKFRNLMAEKPDLEDPFMSSDLSHYFDHLKGPDRKKIGSSYTQT